MDIQNLYYALAAIMILVGIAGTVLPALPGIPLVFAGMLLAAWAGDFAHVGWLPLLCLAILTVLSLVVDFAATAMGAKRVGASRLAIAGAVIGTFAGLFFGLLGIFVGPFVGAVLGEFLHTRKMGQSTRVGIGTWVGIIVGTVFKLGLAFTMLGLFVAALFF